MKKIQEFTSHIKTVGLMRSARYTVIIPSCKSLRSLYSPNSLNTIALLCDRLQIPGLNYSTAANMTYGETREIPYTRLYDNISMSFYVDNDMTTKRYFDDWLFSIQDPSKRVFNYYSNYITNIIIKIEDLNNNTAYGIKLIEAYPKTISAIDLDYSSKEVMKINVNMAYKYWTPIDLSDYEYTPESLIVNNKVILPH